MPSRGGRIRIRNTNEGILTDAGNPYKQPTSESWLDDPDKAAAVNKKSAKRNETKPRR